MKRETVTRIARQVVHTFPEMEGVTPTVRAQEGAKADVFLLTFKGRAALPGGKSLSRIVRVVADDAGHIIRISTSR
jgi:hypothetical protein